jgi:hypothetical protein
MTKTIEPGYRVMDRAYLRDGRTTHSGEALLLACLMHAKGKSRKSPDMTEVQRIMKDQNLKK